MKKRERNSFLTPLVVEVMESGKQFRLHHEFTYTWHRAFDVKITVPVGFVTDFASIPRFARVIIPKLGKYTKAAVVHDFIYQAKSGKALFFDRRGVDHVFRDAMADLGVVKWKRMLMYWAVRIGGAFAWRKK